MSAEIVPLIRPGSPAELIVELARHADEIDGLIIIERDAEGRWNVQKSHDLTFAECAYAHRVLGIVIDGHVIDEVLS